MDRGTQGGGQLLCTIAILIALGGVLAATAGGGKAATEGIDAAAGGGPGSAAPPGATEALDPEELARISVTATPRVARRVEEIRGLEFRRVPRPRVVDSELLNRISRRELERAGSARGLGADEAETRMVGLLAPDEQLEDAFGTTGDLAAAAYDTKRDRLYVIGDAVAPNRALVEFVLAHELTHALEDQRFGLPEGAGASDDGVLAQLALAEGTATSLMTDYGTRHIDPLDLLAGSSGLDAGTGAVPEFYLDQLLWTYLGGSRFVGELRRLGGGWKLVDYALESRPPATTEQVIHPEKYLREEPAVEVEIEPQALTEAGWRRADRGVLGELTTSQLLAVGVPQAAANTAAAGWGGDAYELWRRERAPGRCEHPCRERLVLVVRWAWDRAAEAGEFGAAAARYVEQGLGGRRDGEGTWEVEGGAVVARSEDTTSALVLAPSAKLAAAVAEEQLRRPVGGQPAPGEDGPGESAGARGTIREP